MMEKTIGRQNNSGKNNAESPGKSLQLRGVSLATKAVIIPKKSNTPKAMRFNALLLFFIN